MKKCGWRVDGRGSLKDAGIWNRQVDRVLNTQRQEAQGQGACVRTVHLAAHAWLRWVGIVETRALCSPRNRKELASVVKWMLGMGESGAVRSLMEQQWLHLPVGCRGGED